MKAHDWSGRKAVVVHAGARDSYQLALALSEAGLLDALVTDLVWPSGHWSDRLAERLPRSLRALLDRRHARGIPWSEVRMCLAQGLKIMLLEKLKQVPFAVRRDAMRAADAHMGRRAGSLASRRDAGLVSYSYYGFDAMTVYKRPAMLFQLHPHPATMRRILMEELHQHPDCAASLKQEWELSLPEDDYRHLVDEIGMASRFMVASSFTRDSLIEHGTATRDIEVIPYGVDLDRFTPAPDPWLGSTDDVLHLLFVGRINQRKGIKYLLDALRLVKSRCVRLTICGRVVDDLTLFRPLADQIDIRPSVSPAELVDAYRKADLFVFPSVAEGFGQVLLEALACGLPILSTTHTAAPDLVDEGVEGFVVPPRRPDLLAERIAWALDHRLELLAMRSMARRRAEQFAWSRFRQQAADTVREYLLTL